MGRAKKKIAKKESKPKSSLIASNRKARFDFELGKEIVAGIVLEGSEIKSIRAGQVQLKSAFAKIIDGEVWLFGANIAQYKFANQFNHQPDRPRKLLLHRSEIDKLDLEIKRNNQTLVASKIFFKANRAKVLIHLARGKDKGDKRQSLKRRQQDMDIRSALAD